MSEANSQFDAIRPYRDHEVPAVIQRLMQSDTMIQAIIHVQFPRVSRYLERPLASFVRHRISSSLKNVTTVDEFQSRMQEFVGSTIKKSISEFTFSGIENLEKDVPYVYISNHRDITLDSALLNFSLMSSGLNSAEIAIGDNLLSNPLVSDLLRLNKSFVVNRSVTGIKAKLRALTELSHYISDANQQGRSIWIAQREGRAKDGFDLTDPAIIKMLHIWPKKQGISFADTIAKLNLVPVSISYEYDPCDSLKAKERDARASDDYAKQEGEDLESIMRGISLPKGRVHIQIGKPLKGPFENPVSVAHAIDEHILEGYRLFPPSWLAVEQLLDLSKAVATLGEESRARIQEIAKQAREAWNNLDSPELSRQAAEFSARISQYPTRIQRYMLEMYANPLLNKYKFPMDQLAQP